MLDKLRNGANRVIHPWTNHRVSLYNLEAGAKTTITLGTGKKTSQVVNGKHKKVTEHPLEKVELSGDGKLESFIVKGLAGKVGSKARKSMITDILDPNLRNLLKDDKKLDELRNWHKENHNGPALDFAPDYGVGSCNLEEVVVLSQGFSNLDSIDLTICSPVNSNLPEYLKAVELRADLHTDQLRKPQSFKEYPEDCCRQEITALYDTRNGEILEDSIHEHLLFYPHLKRGYDYPKENMLTATKEGKSILEPMNQHESHRHFSNYSAE